MPTIGQKVDYVKSQPGDGRHRCHWPGCPRIVPPAMWGCRKHWYRLPRRLRAKIWQTFRPGQEVTKTPSAAYVEVAREVQRWIEENGRDAEQRS